MKVALLGIVHESNTFVKGMTDLEQFRKGHWHFGKEILEQYRTAFHEVGGMIAAIEESDIDLVPIMYAEATPGGILTREAFSHLMAEMFRELTLHFPLDGCLVVPHGAGVSEDYPDMDGEWLFRLRELVGPDIPIIGTIDPHANLSSKMVQATQALIAYKTNPHIDQREVGFLAGKLMVNTLKGNIKPLQFFCKLPLAISIEQQLTQVNPSKAAFELAATLCNEQNILSASVVLGFPYADVEDMGSSLLIIADGDAEAGQKNLSILEQYFLENKASFNGRKQDITQLVSSLPSMSQPVLLLDMGDNVGGGAPGDSVYLLDRLEEASLRNSFCCVFDPAAVEKFNDCQPGDILEISIGNRPDLNSIKSRKLELLFKSSGKFEEKNPRHGGQIHFDMGRIAVVKTALDHVVMLTSLRVPPYSLCQLTAFGINPLKFDFIIAKGVNAPVAAYKEVCPSVVQVNTPGLTQADMTQFTYQHRRKPLFPFEEL